MAGSEDLINFDVIESQKENIQALPSGRSAKKLAELYSPSPLHKLSTPTPTDTKNVLDAIRAEYEAEVASLSESDDPLDVFDRYVRWTLDAYPSAQATPQSQLHTLLERATRTFIGSAQYRNDPRYLKLWLHYIHFFSDAPREAYVYLSRHGVGDGLALFYEEYAAWLEAAGRWAQAEEVYKLGIERDARPQARLIRKFGEFEQRRAVAQPDGATGEEPSSPALPTVRPALAVKVDPFAAAAAAAAAAERDPQAAMRQQQQRQGGSSTAGARPAGGKAKMAIFSDASAPTAAPVLSSKSAVTKGWESIGSLSERKKENVMEPKPWAGETLNAGGKKSATKLAVFKDASLAKSHITIHPSQYQVTVNPQNGKKERVFVDLREVYPTPEEPGTERSFEEIWAANRGLLGCSWEEEEVEEVEVEAVEVEDVSPSPHLPLAQSPSCQVGENDVPRQVKALTQAVSTKLVIHRDVAVPLLDENGAVKEPLTEGGVGSGGGAPRPKKKKVMEVNETQIIKAKLDSPSGPKMKKRGSSEPTMTMHTKAATDDIYEIFNQPAGPNKAGVQEDGDGDHDMTSEDDYETDGDYTSGAESTGTTRQLSATGSEAGDEDDEDDEEMEDGEAVDADADGDETSDVKSVSEWSDFTARKHIPNLAGGVQHEEAEEADDASSAVVSSPSANGDSPENDEMHQDEGEEEDDDEQPVTPPTTAEEFAAPKPRSTVFIPIPPEDFVPPTRPYRDPVEVANNRLPFMTPITERTESSLEFGSEYDEQHDVHAKTPSKNDVHRGASLAGSCQLSSSPLIDIVDDEAAPVLPPQPLLPRPKITQPLLQRSKSEQQLPIKNYVVPDMMLNPIDDAIRDEILECMYPPLSSYPGFYDHREEKYERGGEIRKYARAMAKAQNGRDRSSGIGMPVVIRFPDCRTRYTVRRELGAGAFAPVYLVENSHPGPQEGDEGEDSGSSDGGKAAPLASVAQMGRGAFASAHDRRAPLEALKMEAPPSAWEFYMMRVAHSRVGPHHRAAASLSPALECHLYQDETFLFVPYRPHGTLLDVVNMFRGEPSGAMDESLAMFFSIELFRTVEALHARQLMHGDVKVDNCMLRLDLPASAISELSSQYRADGSGGWAERGITLIDFGRGIDMRSFMPGVGFVADWKIHSSDCAEMREGRPWTWQIDYHGLAGALHCLLFGRYMETTRYEVAAPSGSGTGGGIASLGGRRYRIRESLKRYWQTELWAEAFDVLLNPVAHAEVEEGRQMPVLRSMRRVRERMETWLEANCERGVGLKALVAKLEAWARGRK